MKHSDSIVLDGITYVRKEEPTPVKKRREFWIYEWVESELWAVASDDPLKNHFHRSEAKTHIHVREVLDGEITITKEQVLNAMNHFKPSVFDGVGNALFNKFCKELGFKE